MLEMKQKSNMQVLQQISVSLASFFAKNKWKQ